MRAAPRRASKWSAPAGPKIRVMLSQADYFNFPVGCSLIRRCLNGEAARQEIKEMPRGRGVAG